MIVLLDAGHGGIEEGKYVTAGKRYEGPHNGRKAFLAEGAFNRAVVHGIAAHLHFRGVNTHIINPENEDISLHARARRVNAIARRKRSFLLSIHHNAFSSSSVAGAEFFTSVGDTPSDPTAEYIAKSFKDKYPSVRLRKSTVDPTKYSKEAGYYILKSTVCPAVLSEWAFMTNGADRERILNLNEQIYFFTNVIDTAIKNGILK